MSRKIRSQLSAPDHMKLLLDTHCPVWVLTDAPQLDAAQARHGGFRLLSIDRTLATFGAAVITPK